MPRVLLVEDNRVLLWCMRSGLEKAGFTVLGAATAQEAQWLAACFPIDILITDWQLPNGRDGFDVLQEMGCKRPKLLAVLVSAQADGELAERARQAGFDLVLQKPLRIAEIIGAIYCLMGERRMEVSHEAARGELRSLRGF